MTREMPPILRAVTVLLCLVAAGLPPARAQTTVTLTPSQDNTLFESPTGTLSSGAGPFLFAGRTNQGLTQRALFAFDLSALPPGARIDSARLTLSMNQTSAGDQTMTLHRVTAAWGEGTSSAMGGQGAPATAGDATWLHRFFDTDLWATPGGDFEATPSASAVVGAAGTYTWTADPMAADVQAWLDDPATNFGWILLGNETANQTSKRFDSREAALESARPLLTVTYHLPAATALDDAFTLAEDVPFAELDLLANDTGAGGLRIQSHTTPLHGTAVLNSIGTLLLYTPAPDFHGLDSLRYTLVDDTGATDSAGVVLTVTPVNDPPSPPVLTAPADGALIALEGDPDRPLVVGWLPSADVDGDAITYTWQLAPDDAFAPGSLLMALDAGTGLEALPRTGDLALALTAAGVPVGGQATLRHRVLAADADTTVAGPAATLVLTRGVLTTTDAVGLPRAFRLYGAAPNPFTTTTTLRFDLPAPARVSVAVYDVLGRRVLALSPRPLPAGAGHTLRIAGQALPPGLYLYRLLWDDGVRQAVTGRLVHLR